MVELEKPPFDAAAFLASTGLGRKIVQLAPKQNFFTQGDPAILSSICRRAAQKSLWFRKPARKPRSRFSRAGDFVGEESLAAADGASFGDGHGRHRLHRAQDTDAMR